MPLDILPLHESNKSPNPGVTVTSYQDGYFLPDRPPLRINHIFSEKDLEILNMNLARFTNKAHVLLRGQKITIKTDTNVIFGSQPADVDVVLDIDPQRNSSQATLSGYIEGHYGVQSYHLAIYRNAEDRYFLQTFARNLMVSTDDGGYSINPEDGRMEVFPEEDIIIPRVLGETPGNNRDIVVSVIRDTEGSISFVKSCAYYDEPASYGLHGIY